MRKKELNVNILLSIISIFMILITASVFVIMYYTKANSGKPHYHSPVLGTVQYNNINGKDVTVEALTRYTNDVYNNPSFREAEMIYGAIEYKKQHMDEDVTIKISSFHFSVVASACVNRNNKNYGKMTSLYDKEFDQDYMRISYMLVLASKYGIDVTAVGQINASNVNQLDENGNEISMPDYNFEEYFESFLDQDCVEGVEGKVGDYLHAYKSYWTSYDDRSAADMMHLKLCTVSHMLEKGQVKRYGLWQTATNLDGIDLNGSNGNNNLQSGVVIWEHEKMYQTANNVIDLAAMYNGQEQVYEFRNIMTTRQTEQYEMYQSGRENEIDPLKQVLYLGTEDDNVFEMYFTPLLGGVGAWDTTFNPYAKYISKLEQSTDFIIFSFVNPKFNDCELTRIWSQNLLNAFKKVNNPKSRLSLTHPTNDFDYSEIQKGVNAEFISINEDRGTGIHSKDAQLSYVENGQRQYVSVLSTTNIHNGAFSYQANSFIVIKENETTGSNFFKLFGKYNSFGATDF